MSEKIIGIMGAMPEEINGIISLMSDKKESVSGGRTYHEGSINGISVVVVFSRWGKVAASITATKLINHFNVTHLVFIGVAGALSDSLKIGDVVIGNRLIQHDMDARPIMKRYEIPLLGVSYFESDPALSGYADKAVQSFIDSIAAGDFPPETGINNPKVYKGDIASGDKFLSDHSDKSAISEALPDVLCVEMEGAAVAQVCHEHSVPFVVIRTISDEAGNGSHIDFVVFVDKVAAYYGKQIVSSFFECLNN